MFKMLMEVFRKEDLLQQAYDASIEMLKVDKEMFDAAYKSLRNSDIGEMTIDVYAKDALINEYEREIRRKVLAHLVASPSKDLVFGMILVSIVIDIERIGDYVKNIVELAHEHPEKLAGTGIDERVAGVEAEVSQRLEMVIHAFKNSDVEVARAIMRKHRAITQHCDGVVNSLLHEGSSDISSADTVALALYARYLKRISSHITNITSGIVNPFDRIGFSE